MVRGGGGAKRDCAMEQVSINSTLVKSATSIISIVVGLFSNALKPIVAEC